ncbi:MAG TPA: 50S ribosomal protein L6 [Bdellovibrionales bacterium]|nr:50S ribosomal protein L6 [Bdellovibrionales bacterium]
MSRVGKAPVFLDKTVNVTVSPKNEVVVKGAKHSLTIPMRPEIKAKVEDGKVILTTVGNEPTTPAFHGLYRALIQNAVTGVTKGWTRELELNGVGYRAAVSGKKLELTLGYSHPVVFMIPQGIEITVDKQTKIVVNGPSREQVGQVAAKIRSFRPPEPYLGKGVKYADEKIRRKAGKSAAK